MKTKHPPMKTENDLIFERSMRFISADAKSRIKEIVQKNPGRVIDGKEFPKWVKMAMDDAFHRAKREFRQ